MTTEELCEAFTKIGKENGYDEIVARFAAFKDFKIKWVRSYRWAEFDVSDYLKNAPVDVLENIAVTLFRKMRGDTECTYSDNTVDWMTSEMFLKLNQPTYLKRCMGSEGPAGVHKDLDDCIVRLRNAGIVGDDIEGVKLIWSKGDMGEKAMRSSLLMKVVIVNPRLDDEDTPDAVLDTIVLASLKHIGCRFGTDGKRIKETVDAAVESFDVDQVNRNWLTENNYII